MKVHRANRLVKYPPVRQRSGMNYKNILVERDERVTLIRLNRPDKLNALSTELFTDLNHALDEAEADAGVSVIVVAGIGKAFAAGADIAEMAGIDGFAQVADADFITGTWERIPSCRKPVIAAVAGYALGGGCELALMCDLVIAADNARFGQPEIRLGTMAGAGGTQRLTRIIGKSKSMEMHLTGRLMDAQEAERTGIAARVVPADSLVEEAVKTAREIAAFSLPTIRLAKEAVNAAYETTLQEGLRLERRLFHSTFGLDDRREGMKAFVEKRPPNFKHR